MGEVSDVKRSPLPTRRVALKRSRRPLPARSPRRTAEAPERAALVADLLERHPDCQVGAILRAAGHPLAGNCTRRSTQVHERLTRARLGSVLNPANCLTSCTWCNCIFIEEHPAEATALGLLVPSTSAEAEALRRRRRA